MDSDNNQGAIMDSSDIQRRVINIVRDQFRLDASQIKPEHNFVEHFGADSLDVIEIIMGLEDEFDIDVGDEDEGKILTVQQAIDYVAGRLV